TPLTNALDGLDAAVKQLAHEVVTAGLMTLALPDAVLSLACDVPGRFPADLQTIQNADLRRMLGRFDATADTTTGSGVDDWSVLGERIRFIAALFRVYQERPTLRNEPFTAEQVDAINAGNRPAGEL
ncbi:MAG: hypothetical protein ACJ741_06625, partial [Pyrinomonadaceae bacterium]